MLLSGSLSAQGILLGSGYDSKGEAVFSTGVRTKHLMIKTKIRKERTTVDFSGVLPVWKVFGVHTGISYISDNQYVNNFFDVMFGAVISAKLNDDFSLIIQTDSYVQDNYHLDFNITGGILIKLN